jgi:uncharacterized surface protein with fasciclin (FAS1) repeats
MRKISLYSLLAAMLLMGVASCVDNDVKDGDTNFYSATRKTAAQLLADNPERYSLYMELLQRTRPTLKDAEDVSDYFSMLATYGTYTVFVPDNNAMREYLEAGGYASVQDIPEKTCDTIVRNHIISKGAYFTTDYSDGALPAMNMDDRYVIITSDSDVNNNNALLLYVNKHSLIVEKDDSVTNGVVHVINHVMKASNEYLPDLMEEDSTISIFCQALKLTNMADSLTKYIDNTYSVGVDSVTKGAGIKRFGGKDMVAYYKEKRFFKYTAFVETNDVLKKRGITSLEGLIAHAKKVYDETFPGDAGQYDNDFTNRKNPLNRWVSYHLMNRLGNYSDWAPYGEILTQCCRPDVADAEDFWQTMLNEGMIRFCRAAGELYANRKGLKNVVSQGLKGVRVLTDSESGSSIQQALNGRYFYIDDLLEYSTTVRDKVLNCRMRIDATTLSADFMNQGSRGNLGWEENYLFAHKRGYIEGWKISPETFVGVHCDNVWWSSYLGNAVAVKGQYDVQIKLPNPPPGLYEIRLAYVAGEERGVVQVYLNNEPCGIPVDLRLGRWNLPIDIGDYDLNDEEDNRALDKTLRNLGYMLGPDSYGKPGAINFRVDAPEHQRRILTTAQFTEGKEYWLRFRQVLEGDAEWSFDYLELCPKSVYASAQGENRH